MIGSSSASPSRNFNTPISSIPTNTYHSGKKQSIVCGGTSKTVNSINSTKTSYRQLQNKNSDITSHLLKVIPMEETNEECLIQKQYASTTAGYD